MSNCKVNGIKEQIAALQSKLKKLQDMKSQTECDIDQLIRNLNKINKAIKAVQCRIKKLLVDKGTKEQEEKIRDEIRELQQVKCRVGKEEKSIEMQIQRRLKQIKQLHEKKRRKANCGRSKW